MHLKIWQKDCVFYFLSLQSRCCTYNVLLYTDVTALRLTAGSFSTLPNLIHLFPLFLILFFPDLIGSYGGYQDYKKHPIFQ